MRKCQTSRSRVNHEQLKRFINVTQSPTMIEKEDLKTNGDLVIVTVASHKHQMSVAAASL